MKKYTHITLVGNVSIDYDYKWCNKLGDIVSGVDINKPLNTKFSITNNELELQRMINNINLKNSIILTPLTLYKKYLFFNNVDYLPSFPDEQKLHIDIDSCSTQLLSLLCSIWCEYDKVFLFGYNIEDLNERELLIRVAANNPHVQIYYCRKPNANKIKLFDHLPNVSVMDYKEFKKYAEENTK